MERSKLWLLIIGSNYQPISTSFANVPILGDGSGGKQQLRLILSERFLKYLLLTEDKDIPTDQYNSSQALQASESGGVLANLTNTGIGTTSNANFNVIIPPKGGHGYDIYRELGAYRALLYSRFETLETNPDIIEGNDFARVGLIKNPTVFGSSTELLDTAMVSG